MQVHFISCYIQNNLIYYLSKLCSHLLWSKFFSTDSTTPSYFIVAASIPVWMYLTVNIVKKTRGRKFSFRISVCKKLRAHCWDIFKKNCSIQPFFYSLHEVPVNQEVYMSGQAFPCPLQLKFYRQVFPKFGFGSNAIIIQREYLSETFQ